MKTNGKVDRIKANGVHYTPPELAKFLAEAVIRHLKRTVDECVPVEADAAGPSGQFRFSPKLLASSATRTPPSSARLNLRNDEIRILDPACGEGALLQAVATAAPPSLRKRLVLTGYEMDESALANAKAKLDGTGVARIELKHQDFLAVSRGGQPSSSHGEDVSLPEFDAVIANPPYVRTQVLGAKISQLLARQFGLTGRVDLYQAFAFAMGNALKQGGVLALLTSNRLLTTNSGEKLRKMLRGEYTLRELYDLGDTKLFNAAVLPAIVVACKGTANDAAACHFARVYESRNGISPDCARSHLLEMLTDDDSKGLIETPAGIFLVEKGTLAPNDNLGGKWSLSTPEYDDWLRTLRSHQRGVFQDIASVRVGIKTTADKVFVRTDWESLDMIPEQELLHPLLTHREAARWHAIWGDNVKQVLYPYDMSANRKQPVGLAGYPNARDYLETHEDQLRGRSYVIEAGREWYEIWVPQVPSQWAKPKIVFPDISEHPKFFLDRSGAIVQGDCYWITLNDGVDPDWLLIMLAVANSMLGTKYYDIRFHNKLYAGRRRFMTQYVKQFPLPNLDPKALQVLARVVERLIQGEGDTVALEQECDEIVWGAFGLARQPTIEQI